MSDADRTRGQIHPIRGGKDDSHRLKDPCDGLRQSSRLISLDIAALWNSMRKERTRA